MQRHLTLSEFEGGWLRQLVSSKGTEEGGEAGDRS